MKIILKIFISIILILLIITTYLSTIGIETDRFNNQIKDKIKSIDEKTEIELKTLNACKHDWAPNSQKFH